MKFYKILSLGFLTLTIISCATGYKKIDNRKVLESNRIAYRAQGSFDEEITFEDMGSNEYKWRLKIEEGQKCEALAYNPESDSYFIHVGTYEVEGAIGTKTFKVPYKFSAEIFSDGRLKSKTLYLSIRKQRPPYFKSSDVGKILFKKINS